MNERKQLSPLWQDSRTRLVWSGLTVRHGVGAVLVSRRAERPAPLALGWRPTHSSGLGADMHIVRCMFMLWR